MPPMVESRPAPAFEQSRETALGRFSRLWPYKLVGATVGFTLFFTAYFHVLRHPLFPVTVMPLTFVDRWIAFSPWWMAPYVSLWVYVTLPPFLLTDRRELAVYGAGAVVLSAVGLAFFFFWPTIVPAIDPGADWVGPMRVLKTVDASGNACPSLHVAFACFSAFWLENMLKRMNASMVMRWLNAVWALAIAVSTMGTKQHVLWDAVGGAALGIAVALLHRAAWRRFVIVRHGADGCWTPGSGPLRDCE